MMVVDQQLTIKVCTPHKTDVNAKIAVIRRTVEAQIDAKGYGRPCRILGSAVETYLVCLLAFELLEKRLRLNFRRERHGVS